MTDVVNAGGAGVVGGSGRGAGKKGVGGNPWRRLWQIPLLVAGLGTFGFGLKLVVKALRPVPFETHVADVQNMLAAGRFTDAVARINVLANSFSEPKQLATLEVLAGDALYLAQQKQPAIVRENFEGVVRHYDRAARYGFEATATFDERWAEAAMALGDAPTAIEKFEAAAVDSAEGRAVLQAHVHELVAAYLAVGQTGKAQEAVDRLLANAELPVDERSWGLCQKIRMALGSGDAPAGQVEGAVGKALAALPGMAELDPAGRVLMWVGRAELGRGKKEEARGHLEEARAHFIVHHLDDGRSALLLARLAQAAYGESGKSDDLEKAAGLYQEVVTGHAGTTIWAAARLGRAEMAAMRNETGGVAGETMTADYRFAIRAVTERGLHAIGEGSAGGSAEFLTLEGVRGSLIAAQERASTAGRLEDALHFIALQQELGETETAADALRLATARERRARELLAGAGDAETKKREALALLGQAAADYLRHSHLTTMEDEVSGNSLWKAAELFDAAGESARSAAVYEQFTAQRPRDSRVPEGLLATGRLYQSVGAIDKAIPIYQRDIQENAKTPAAYKSTVNLARCYMSQGPEGFEKAEGTLLSLVQDNRDILPTANEFRTSLFTLGELYFGNGRWADAILRLEEALERYPDDAGAPRAMFKLAESYRRSAEEIAAAVKGNPAMEGRAALEAARGERFERAVMLFGRVIGALDPASGEEESGAVAAAGLSALDGDYLRKAYMDRAGTAYERGDYLGAIKFYDGVSARFPTEPLAVESYVQIVNAYEAMQEPAQASAAAERAQWVLKRIPDEAFAKGRAALSRQYYENFLKVAAPR